jgi:uncharacterized membrane protein
MNPGPHMDISAMWVSSALWWLVSIAAVIALVWLVGAFLRSDREARRLLEERLARGEIDIDDYRGRVALIEGATVGR